MPPLPVRCIHLGCLQAAAADQALTRPLYYKAADVGFPGDDTERARDFSFAGVVVCFRLLFVGLLGCFLPGWRKNRAALPPNKYCVTCVVIAYCCRRTPGWVLVYSRSYVDRHREASEMPCYKIAMVSRS
jgi:hypothetical protein